MNILNNKTVGFIGLGSIGQHLAAHLQTEGATVRVYNRSGSKQEAWLSEHPGAVGASSASNAATGADFVVTCVGNDEDLKDVYLADNGLISALKPGVCVIDHTTASDNIAITLETRVRSVKGLFVDAPVSGGSVGAKNRALSIMVGGADDSFIAAEPILRLYGRAISHIGPAGSGQLCKMVNQVCIAGVLEGLAEGLGLARAAGLDTERVLQAISGGAASSWQMNNRSSYMLSENYPAGFAARLMFKDLGLSLDAADSRALSLPVAALVNERYAMLLKTGFGDEDFSNLYRLIVKKN